MFVLILRTLQPYQPWVSTLGVRRPLCIPSDWLLFDEAFEQPCIFAVVNCADVALIVLYSPILAKPVAGKMCLCGAKILFLYMFWLKKIQGTTKFWRAQKILGCIAFQFPPPPWLRTWFQRVAGYFCSYELLCLRRLLIIYVHYSDTLQPTTSKDSACRHAQRRRRMEAWRGHCPSALS